MKKLRRENPNNRKNKVVVIVQQGRKSDIYIRKKTETDNNRVRTEKEFTREEKVTCVIDVY
jgi:hypothetical protein